MKNLVLVKLDVLTPTNESYTIKENVEVISLTDMIDFLMG